MVPVYNEREILKKNVGILVEYMDGLGEDYEILVCSNGSTDGTEDIGKVIERQFAGKLRFFTAEKRGVGVAFKKMVSEARFEKLVSMDADLTSDLDFIKECSGLLKEHDMVLGSKMMGEQHRQLHRIIISKGYIGLVHMLLGMGFGDYSIGTKGYRRGKILPFLDCIDEGSSYVVEVAYKVSREGTIIEVPVFCHDERGSKFNLVHEVFYRFNNLLRFWIRERLR